MNRRKHNVKNNLIRLDYLTATSALNRLRALRGTNENPVALINWPNTQPYCFGWDGLDGYDYVPMDMQLRALLNETPNLRFILSFGSLHGTPYYWARDHLEELALFHLGKPMQQASLGSALWTKESSEAARRYAAHFSQSEFSDRIVGFFPFSTAVDWHGIGETLVNIPAHETPGNTEFPLEGDFSKPMLAAFRAFLTERYETDRALQAAWKNSGITLATAEIPTRIEVRSPLPNVRDYFECYNELNAKLCIAWCEALKAGAPDKTVLVTHGQTFGWPAENLSPQGSGHNAPERLLASPAIDGFISSAAVERDQRNPLPRHATASLHLHGKQVFHELNLLGLREISHANQCAEITLAVGYAAVNQCGISLGEPREGRGSMKDSREQFNPLPCDDDAVRAHLKKLLVWHASASGKPMAEVAVFHSPRGSYHRAMEKRFNEVRIEKFRNETLARIGLPFDEYLLSDFAAVSKKYKAWIFIDAADISSKDWKTVEEHPGRALFAAQGKPITDPATLCAFAKRNGVDAWCDSNDTLFANDSVCVFAAHTAGKKTIRLPKGNWINALTGEPSTGVFQTLEKQVILLARGK
jgi:hypothetical protein